MPVEINVLANIELFIIIFEFFLSEFDVLPLGATPEQSLLLFQDILWFPPVGMALTPNHVVVEVLIEGFDGGHGSEHIQRVHPSCSVQQLLESIFVGEPCRHHFFVPFLLTPRHGRVRVTVVEVTDAPALPFLTNLLLY